MFTRLVPWNGLPKDLHPNHLKAIPFYAVHLVGIAGLFFVTHSIKVWTVCIALYFIRMFFVTGGFHRYFGHNTYSTSRWFQFLMALGTTTTAQKGLIWWISWHIAHHLRPDRPGDPHDSREGFYYSHVGWILCGKYDHIFECKRVRQLRAFKEIVWINKYWIIGPATLALALFLWGGWSMLIIGFFTSTVLLYHGTFLINSGAHVEFLSSAPHAPSPNNKIGSSQNSWLLAFLTLGEGWHNYHHHMASSTKQSERWWEIDITFCILWLLSKFGLVWDLKVHSDFDRGRIAA